MFVYVQEAPQETHDELDSVDMLLKWLQRVFERTWNFDTSIQPYFFKKCREMLKEGTRSLSNHNLFIERKIVFLKHKLFEIVGKLKKRLGRIQW